MNKIISLILILILLGGTNGFGEAEKHAVSSKIFSYSVDFSHLEIKENNGLIKINIDGANNIITKSDKVILPLYVSSFSFPIGTKILNVSCTHSKPSVIPLNGELARANDHITNPGYRETIYRYISKESIKSTWFSYKAGCGIEKGEHKIFLSIYLYPVRYENDTLKFVNHMDIQVAYITSDKIPRRDDYDLLIISPKKFIENLKPLVDHKNSLGISTKLVSLKDIYDGIYFPVQGRDNPERIKYFIKNSLDTWNIKYVLLIGGIDKLPIRETWLGELVVPTDLYYADIYDANYSFCSWDTNNNSYFGEYRHGWVDDYVDLYPDVYIGRIPCENNVELKTVINKIISYEEEGNKDWFNNILLCGGDTHPHYGVYEGEVTVEEIKNNLTMFNPIELITSKDTFNPWLINKAVNNGVGFIAYSGHGFEYGIGTHPPNSEDWIYYLTPYILGLHNKEKLPVIFFDACLTARLDYTVGDLLGIKSLSLLIPCFAWYWVKYRNGGAIATIGATRVAYTIVDEEGVKGGSGYLSLHFFKSYHKDITIGEMLVSAQNDYLNYVWKDPMTLEEMILIGDPSICLGG